MLFLIEYEDKTSFLTIDHDITDTQYHIYKFE